MTAFFFFPLQANRPITCAVIFASLWIGLVSMVPVQAESWTDLRGTRTVEARLIGVWGESVMLEMRDGRRIMIKKSGLRSESRIQAGKLAKEIRQRQTDRVSELRAIAAAAAAAAPDPLPTPSPAPPYQKPAKDLAADAFLGQVDQAISDGHLIALYDSLPPAYRRDIDELVSIAANKVDPLAYKDTIDGIRRIADSIVMKQSWLLSSPRLKSEDDFTNDVGDIEGPMLALATMVYQATGSEVFKIEKVRTQPFGEWLKELDVITAPYLHQSQRSKSGTGDRRITLDASNDDMALIKIESNEIETGYALQKVEGFWVPKSMAPDLWKVMVDDAKAQLAELQSDTVMGQVLSMVEAVDATISPLSDATNANDYHAAMEVQISKVVRSLTIISDLLGLGWDFTPPEDESTNGLR